MNLASSLSWLHYYGCPIIREYKVSTILCKLHQEIAPRKRSTHVVGYLGGVMPERCLCRRARANQCNSKVSRLSLSYTMPGVLCQGKRVSSHICLALPSHSRAAPVLFLGISVSGEIISWICSLLNCKHSITMHRDYLPYTCAVLFVCR